MSTLLLLLLNQNHWRDTFHVHKNTVAENIKNDVIKVFTQTEFDEFSGTEISSSHTFLPPPENFANKHATHYSKLKLCLSILCQN